MPPLAALLTAAGPPLDPTSEEATRWLRDELTSGGYSTQPSLRERFWEWLQGLLDGVGGASAPGWLLPLVILVLLVLAVAVLMALVRREPRRGAQRTGAVLEAGGSSAADYRTRARAALGAQDWDAALLDAVRAIASGVTERAVLPEAPGRTAQELAHELAAPFPTHADALVRVADRFDAVRYGDEHAEPDAARAALELDEALAGTRPAYTETAPWSAP